jgi:hypothetical protein
MILTPVYTNTSAGEFAIMHLHKHTHCSNCLTIQCWNLKCTNFHVALKMFNILLLFTLFVGFIKVACRGHIYVAHEVLTAVVKKSSIFWDITPCSPLKAKWRFGGTYGLHLARLKMKLWKKSAWSRQQAQFLVGFLLGLLIYLEDGCDMYLWNIGLLSTDYTALYPRRQNSSRHIRRGLSYKN